MATTRRAGNADRAWIEKWLAAMPMDVILLAAERAQGTQLPRKYMGKLLANWQKKGIKTVEEAQKEEPVVRMDTAKPQAGRSFRIMRSANTMRKILPWTP